MLTLVQKVAQCVFPRLNIEHYENDIQYRNSIIELTKIGCGGFCIFGGNIELVKKVTAELQYWASVPLLLCADFEHGLPMRLEDGTSFPHHLALAKASQSSGTHNWTHEVAAAIAKEAKAIGIRWNLAPVCDINSNPQNPVINIRAFGDNKQVVINNVIQYINATQNEHVAACAKHFPGHGDTDTDSHLQFPAIDKSPAQLEQNEIEPFVAAMKNNVKAIMLGHLLCKWRNNNADNESPKPASLDAATVQYLRQINIADKGATATYWDGIIMTDALDMQAIVDMYGNKAGLYAFIAGMDVILMPANPQQTIQLITQKIEQSTDNMLLEQLERSASRIHKLKQWTKLIPRYAAANDQPQLFIKHMQLALKAAVAATNIIPASQPHPYIPMPEAVHYAALSIMQRDEDIQSASRFFTMLAQATENDCDYSYIDENISNEQLTDIANGIQDAKFIVFALFYRGRGYSKQLASADKLNTIIETIAEGREYIIICFGDPYIADNLHGGHKILTYSDSFASLASAVMLLADRHID